MWRSWIYLYLIFSVKNKAVLLLVTFSLIVSVQLRSQSPGDTLSPLRVIEKYVSTDGFPEKLRHFCCEMYQEWTAQQTLGQQLAPSVIRECRLLYGDTARAVVTVWLHDSITSMDVYFYLQHRQVWTVYAVRSLVMKDYAKAEIKRLDSIPWQERGKVYTKTNGHTWQFDHDNAVLWSASDTVLAQHFYSYSKEFRKLEQMRQSMKRKSFAADSSGQNLLVTKKMSKTMDKLLLRAIRDDRNAPGTVLYLVGGVLDNSVGYMYQPDPSRLPQVSAGYFILIRPLGNGWYLYKTT